MQRHEVEEDLRRRAVGSLFLIFTATKADGATVDAYVAALEQYQGRDVRDACAHLREQWKSQAAPRPAHIIKSVWKVIHERKREERTSRQHSGEFPHPAPRKRGDFEIRLRFLEGQIARQLDPDYAHVLMEQTSGIETGMFLRVSEEIHKRSHTTDPKAGDLWLAFDEVSAEDLRQARTK